MPNCTFHIVDAFTAVPFTGNPCAVVTDADGIEPADMLRIARETNAPETAFVLASDKADVRVRYFMPRGEIPLRASTIATGHLLRELGVLKPGTAVRVRHRRAARGHPPRQGDHDPAPAVPDTCADAGTMAQALGLQASDLREGLPCQLMRGRQLPDGSVRELAALRRINTGQARPQSCFGAPRRVGGVRVRPEGVEPETDVHARLIDPDNAGKILSPDRPPGAWLPTCTRTGCVPGRASGEQGHILDRPGTGELELILASDSGKLDAVRLGGTAVSSASGTLRW
ncbi:MAG: PhzF family phenazine biosynthesis protein [Bilophila wadsworthia]